MASTLHRVSEAVEKLVRQYTMAFNLFHMGMLDDALAAYA